MAIHGWGNSVYGSGSICHSAKIEHHSNNLGFIGVCVDGIGAVSDKS